MVKPKRKRVVRKAAAARPSKKASKVPARALVFTHAGAFGNDVVGISLFFSAAVSASERKVVEAAVPEPLRHLVAWPSSRMLVTSAAEWYGLDHEPSGRWLKAFRTSVDEWLDRAHVAVPLSLVYATNAMDLPGIARRAREGLDTGALPTSIAALSVLWSPATKIAPARAIVASNITYAMMLSMADELARLSDEDRARLQPIHERASRGMARGPWKYLAERLELGRARMR